MKRYIFFAFILLHFHAIFSQQDSSRLVLEALNRQVDYLNEMDADLYPEYQKLISLNQEMWDYYHKKTTKAPEFTCNFHPDDQYYKKAVYNKLFLPEGDRDDLLKRLDSLKSTLHSIEKNCNGLENYLKTRGFEKDEMKQGFAYLERLGGLSRTYLVRHEDLHSVLMNVWYDFYVKKRGKNIHYLTILMNRILSQLHVVYLDLGYDPGYADTNKHLKEVNRLIENLRSRSNGDTLAANSKDFMQFATAFDTSYFENYGEKGTIEFYRKYNNGFIKELNNTTIPAFNRFIESKKLLCIKGKTEPPFYTALSPIFPEKVTPPKVEPRITVKKDTLAKVTLPKITPPKPVVQDTVVKNAPLPPKPISDPKKPDKPIVDTPPISPPPIKDTVKASALEGFAYNNLIFLLDVSGSMKSGGRLDTMRNAMKYIVEEMRAQDKIGIITYSGNAQVLLRPTPASQKAKILTALNSLNSNGQSNLRMGLDYAYTQMMANRIKDGNNRIIVVTDGYIPIGEDLNQYVSSYADDDITLSVFLFGNLADPKANADKLATLAEKGKGNFTSVSRTNAKNLLLKEAQAIEKK